MFYHTEKNHYVGLSNNSNDECQVVQKMNSTLEQDMGGILEKAGNAHPTGSRDIIPVLRVLCCVTIFSISITRDNGC